MMKRKQYFLVLIMLSLSRFVFGAEASCPSMDDPAPVILKVDLPQLVSALESVEDLQGNKVLKVTEEAHKNLQNIFESVPQKTKLEQFFQLLYLIQENVPESALPLEVKPSTVSKVLLTAKVFTDDSFPQKITSVTLKSRGKDISPMYVLNFSSDEVRFAINQGKGFMTWEEGMCQHAKELVFYPGFSFNLRQARNSKNLIVDNFDKVQIFGDFGTRKLFSIDLNYVDLEKVEFIEGTDQGKVKSRVAKREFEQNKHSALFKFVGTLIPNTSKQRIDW